MKIAITSVFEATLAKFRLIPECHHNDVNIVRNARKNEATMLPGTDTALKWENPKRRRGWPDWGVNKQLHGTCSLGLKVNKQLQFGTGFRV